MPRTKPGSTFRCHDCGGTTSKTLQTFSEEGGRLKRRKRRCARCGREDWTVEVTETRYEALRKDAGRR